MQITLPMNNSTAYLVAPAVVSEHFDDEVIIVNMTRGHYYSLRGSAAALWQQLEKGATVDTLSQYLMTHYATDSVNVDVPLTAFATQLIDEQLIIATDRVLAAEPLAASASTERLPFEAPRLEVYTDMADLLALDPIHDVSSADGWPTKK